MLRNTIRIKFLFILAVHILLGTPASFAQQQKDSAILKKIFDESLSKGKCYAWLGELCKGGPRLSGSVQAENAVNWGKKIMTDCGFEKVYLQDVMVPHWVRGAKEEAWIITSKGKMIKVPICALGMSIGTDGKPITAEVVEVHDFDELKKLGKEKGKGKFIFFNRPMNPKYLNTFHAYGDAVNQRGQGALQAGMYGGVGAIVRSMSLSLTDNPHTGAMRKYVDSITKVPAAAISTNGAELLSQMLKEDPHLKIKLTLSAETLPDVLSHNVVGEIKGTDHPEEIIVLGGHLDSWDLGTGAHDDGAGVVQSMEALRLLLAAGIKPKRTIRIVLFMNEENGLKGGLKYAELSLQNKDKHIAAIETDRGGFMPVGFSISAEKYRVDKLRSWMTLFHPYGLYHLDEDGGGADISPLKEQGVPQLDLMPETQRYFDFHHAKTDTFDGVNKRELEMGAASLAGLLYLMSEYGF